MQKLKIPYLAINLWFLVLVSCGSNKLTAGFTPTTNSVATYNTTYFSNPENDYVYKANIEIYGKSLTGIFIAKKINDTTHRVVFTTEFGNKLIDFEVSEHDFKVNSIVSELDRKIVINTLRDDFRLLLRKQFSILEQFENEDVIVYKSNDSKQSDYMFVSKKDNKLVKIIHTSSGKEKINIRFTSESGILADTIDIIHHSIKLRISFNHFNN